MKRTMTHGLVLSLSASLLVACGGGGTTDSSSSSSGSKLLATTATCYAAWNSTTAYTAGQTASYASVNYTAAYWTQGQNPSTNSGAAGSGQPWVSNGACGSTSTSPTMTEASSISTGSNLSVSYSVPSSQLSTKNWIGVYPAGVTPGTGTNSSAWAYAPNASGSVTVNTSGLAAGSYAVWYLYNDGYTVLKGPQSLSISSGAATISEPSSINAGGNLSVSYSVPSSKLSTKNWIGVYRAGVTPGSGTNSSAWAYAPNASGSVTVNTSGLAAGSYAVWYLYNDGYTVLSGPKSLAINGGTSSGGMTFGPYKDVTVNLNWNTNVMSTKVTGTLLPVTQAMPSKLSTVTWAFATGECGSENWGGVQGPAMASANVSAFVNAGKKYILSTGGAAGSFSCGSDSGFETFIQRYNSSNLVGVDFDIEAGQTQSVIDNLIQRVKTAQGKHPNLRFSFTLATLGGSSSQSLGSMGVNVMNSIKSSGLTNYYVDLMVMDYGSANSSNCTMGSNGRCDMGKSAIQAAINLHNYWGVPYNRIELTPMIGGNDAQDETFDLGDVDEMTSWARSNAIAGIHYWSLDRDTDCAPGFASPTCNSYGQAGNWGFANRFIADLGL